MVICRSTEIFDQAGGGCDDAALLARYLSKEAYHFGTRKLKTNIRLSELRNAFHMTKEGV
jgi:hypothetical protein